MMDLGTIAVALGLRRAGREFRGRCPCCGYGSDAATLRLHRGRPSLWCASCRDAGGLRAALHDAAGGRPCLPAVRNAQDGGAAVMMTKAAKQRRALEIWSEGRPIAGTAAERYLAQRGVLAALDRWPPHPAGEALRYLPRCWHGEARKHLPAMVAAIRDPQSGAFAALHRTYLRPDGSGKADVASPRRTLGDVRGGAVLLHAPPVFAPLVLGEGLETAAAAALLIGGPCWASTSAGGLAAMKLPEAVRAVMIAADADAPGLRAAGALARRLRDEGRAVDIVAPDQDGLDFNNLLQRRMARGVEHG